MSQKGKIALSIFIVAIILGLTIGALLYLNKKKSDPPQTAGETDTFRLSPTQEQELIERMSASSDTSPISTDKKEQIIKNSTAKGQTNLSQTEEEKLIKSMSAQ